MGVMGVFSVTLAGCKKKETAVQNQTSAVQAQVSAVHEKIAQAKFSTAVPSGLPNVPAFPGGIGDVEWINNQPTKGEIKISKKNKVSVIGWAANNANGKVPSTIIIQLSQGNNTYYANATKTKQKREDIAKATKIPAFADSAWQLDADIRSLPSGKYLFSMILSDGAIIVGFDTNKSLVVE